MHPDVNGGPRIRKLAKLANLAEEIQHYVLRKYVSSENDCPFLGLVVVFSPSRNEIPGFEKLSLCDRTTPYDVVQNAYADNLDSVVTGEDSQDGQKSINFRILARLRINQNGKREQARRLRQSGSSDISQKIKIFRNTVRSTW